MFTTLLHSKINKHLPQSSPLLRKFNIDETPATLKELVSLVRQNKDHYASDPAFRAKVLAKFLPKNNNIASYLDLGCNDGKLTALLGRKYLHLPKDKVHGVDVGSFDGEIQASKKIMYQTYDGETLPYQDEQFELVTSIHVLHHVSLHQLEPLIQHLYRVLKPGGFLLVREHDCASTHDAAMIDLEHFVYMVQEVDPKNLKQRVKEYQATYRPRTSWQTLLEKHGFRKKYGTKTSSKPTKVYTELFVKPDKVAGGERLKQISLTEADAKKLFPPTEHWNQLQITNEARYSVCLPKTAKQLAKIVRSHFPLSSDPVVIDGTSNVGGMTIALAKEFHHVHAIDLQQLHTKMLKNNLNVYNITNVTTYTGDFFDVSPKITAQAVVLDPPWGGSSYNQQKVLHLKLGGRSVEKFVPKLFQKISGLQVVAVFAPRNTNLQVLMQCVKYHLQLRIHTLSEHNQKAHWLVVFTKNSLLAGSMFHASKLADCKAAAKQKHFRTITTPNELTEFLAQWTPPTHLPKIPNHPIHQGLTMETLADAVKRTMHYYFDKLAVGILVQIRSGKVTLIHLTNLRFKNDWNIQLDVKAYANKKRQETRRHYEKFDYNTSNWTANNCMVGSTYPRKYSERRMKFLQTMLAEACKAHNIPDCDFMLNRRDFPTMARDGSHPYEDLVDPSTYSFPGPMLPVFGLCTTPRHADVPLPNEDDWEQVTDAFYPPDCREQYQKKSPQVPWDQLENKAVWRGKGTGCGITEETNQRLKLHQLSIEWAQTKPGLLDAGVVGWNAREKMHKDRGRHVEYLPRTNKTHPPAKWMTLEEQAKYKYRLNVDGHVAAFRLSSLLRTNCVILHVASPRDYQLWYSQGLKPNKHYVPVQADLSDLEEKIRWCQQHDDECRKISENASKFAAKYLSKEAMLRYVGEAVIML